MMYVNFDNMTPAEISTLIANRLRAIRKRRRWSQELLAEKSGVSHGSIKRFERTGEVSFVFLIKIAIALNCESEIEQLFSDVPFNSIQEVINGKG
ncbi:MAG: helix-turn-helix transcriptional regulator [Clostridiales bacterium]|nr:helix-turn-helix transcriptional regulator [Clostridiales bacterium]